MSNNGKVTLAGTPSTNSKTVTLTGTPGSGGTPQVYIFTVNNWYTTPGKEMTHDSGSAHCSDKGAVQISSEDVNSVLREWGGLNAYSTSDFGMASNSNFLTFTSTPFTDGEGTTNYVWRDMFNIILHGNSAPDIIFYVTCRTGI
ncbi:MAG: hypothetical protein JO226_11225 [Pluralibacter sp.]|nr:hypothetical protein [Pluralibacter sp.]